MAAYTKSIERITTTFPATSAEETQIVNLTQGQDPTKCVPKSVTQHFTVAATDARNGNAVSVEMIDNAGTPAARIKRRGPAGSSPGAVEVHVTIQEYGGNVTVQQGGPVTLSGTTATATITAVNQANALVIATQHATSTTSSDDFNDFFVYCKFNSDTEIQFSRQAGGPPDWNVYWYVVESNGVDFQTEYLEIFPASNATGPIGVTLSKTVTLANAYLICGYQSSESADDLKDAIWGFALTATDTLTYYRNHGSTPSAAAIFGIWVVRTDSNGANVQRFATDTNGQSVTNQTITSVDTSRTALLSSNHATTGSWAVDSSTSGRNVEERQSSLSLTSATNVAIEKRLTSVSGTNPFLRFEVVEFEIESAGPFPQTIPVNRADETDTVFEVKTVPGAVSRTIGLASETDTVFTVTPIALPPAQKIDVGLAAETDEAFEVKTVPGELTVSIGLASETDVVSFVTPVLEGGPQKVLILNALEQDQVFAVTPRLETGEIAGGLPIRPKRKRRYILPDNRVFDDPDRALFELRQLLRQSEASEPKPEASGVAPSQPSSAYDAKDENVAPEAFSPATMTRVFRELPALIEARPAEMEPIDPQLLSVLFERIDDEEAAILLL